MIETKRKTIAGREWSVVTFTGTKSIKVWHMIGTALGPALGQFISTAVNAKISTNAGGLPQVDFAKGVQLFLNSNASSAQLEADILQLLSNTSVDGTPLTKVIFDDTFAGPAIFNLKDVLLFVFEANYGDFTAALRSFIGQFSDVEFPVQEPAPAG